MSIEIRVDESRRLTVEGEVEISDREPRHDQGDGVEDRLNVEEEKSNNSVIGLVQSREMSEGVDSSGERSVEPSSTLTDQLSRTLGNIAVENQSQPR